jgi:2-phospho-L-lactate guanylyltransferase (CobY/MobA/RfbA family)
MHQQLVQWVDDDIEVVQADDSVSVANVEPAFWEYQGIIASQERTGVNVLLSQSVVINIRFKQSALIAIFNG